MKSKEEIRRRYAIELIEVDELSKEFKEKRGGRTPEETLDILNRSSELKGMIKILEWVLEE